MSSLTSFNPTLVRLAPYPRAGYNSEGERFNPTLVRLALFPSLQCIRIPLSFNPTLVRLAPGAIHEIARALGVSIPPWFD